MKMEVTIFGSTYEKRTLDFEITSVSAYNGLCFYHTRSGDLITFNAIMQTVTLLYSNKFPIDTHRIKTLSNVVSVNVSI